MLSHGTSPYTPTTGAQSEFLGRFIDTVGDGSGTKDFIGDYSGGVQSAYIRPPAGRVFRIAKIVGEIEDAGAFNATQYGNGIVLANGIHIEKTVKGVTTDLLDNQNIYTNADWERYTSDFNYLDFGSGTNILSVGFNFLDAGVFVRLCGDTNDEIKMTFNDDFRGLIAHTFFCKGYYEQ